MANNSIYLTRLWYQLNGKEKQCMPSAWHQGKRLVRVNCHCFHHYCHEGRCPAHCLAHRRCSVNTVPSPCPCSHTSQGRNSPSIICRPGERRSRVGSWENRGCFFPGSLIGPALLSGAVSGYMMSLIILRATCFQVIPQTLVIP